MIYFEQIKLRFGVPANTPMAENLMNIYAQKMAVPFILNLPQGPVIQTQEATLEDAKIKNGYIVFVMDCRNGKVDSAWCLMKSVHPAKFPVFPEVECLSVS